MEEALQLLRAREGIKNETCDSSLDCMRAHSRAV